ncbi:tripartite ATP-independent transporter solute receptor, DctP family [Desulfacinum infernum DSM 9756]|uniref:Tripartite ATP-independent transporter solute receptor, DctP family n=1 Tax=Desulfacinum infernum DSM 9756 TaxID=1121391 RepID=A0A1M4Y7Y0_9BACT|nr:DctP family TRAP transporter solute-binding subunit [Desulfacinum infernum]SHF01828.1 tripartite ATP-independent transporter solute receptor, DctP family [Desulfacinum infernum DSM 9756]
MKRMRGFRGLFWILVLICAVVVVPAAASADKVTIKLGHSDPDDPCVSKKGAAARVFKDMVEAETGGTVEVQVFPANQLGGEREMIESTKLGTIQMCIVSGAIAGYFRPAMVLDIPYLFNSPAVAWKVLDGPFGKELSEALLKETGLRNLAYAETGFRHFTNSKRPVRTPADLKGLKIRVMETPLYITMVKALGAAPTPIAWPEVYSALQQKVVDGQENPVGTILNAKFAEVQKYLTLDGHSYGTDFILINDQFYSQKLTDEQRRVIRQAAIVAGNVGRSIQQLNSAMGLSKLKEQGMEIYSPTAEERAQFKAACQGAVIEWLKTEIDPSWIEKALVAVAEAEKQVQ